MQIIIGNQIWMQRNLSVDRFRNGDVIPEARTTDEWEASVKYQRPAWCHFENDWVNDDVYGKLYNGWAVGDPRGIAPLDWHVPSDDEWTVLTELLGADSAAWKMKSTSGWNSLVGKGGNGGNKSGFTGLPGGFRGINGVFESGGTESGWWSSTSKENELGWGRMLSLFDQQVIRSLFKKGTGLYVRCLRDFVIPVADPIIRPETDSVLIGNQVWMNENLNVDRFRNGDPIAEAKTKLEWRKADTLRIPVWCYPSNEVENGQRYGRLYNIHAVYDSRGLAPQGWHIPTANEWEILFDFLGGKEQAGWKLKGISGWERHRDHSGNGSGESGFNALPAGFRDGYGDYSEPGCHGIWWHSTRKSGKDRLWYPSLNNRDAKVGRRGNYADVGYSVRCIRDTADGLK